MRFSNQCLSAMILAVALSSAPALWAADEGQTSARSDDTLVTNFRGRPPFKRQLLSRDDVAELARFEETAARPTGDDVRVVEFRGRPPFKREILAADEVADLARFEETSSSSETRRTRRGPPGKLISRR